MGLQGWTSPDRPQVWEGRALAGPASKNPKKALDENLRSRLISPACNDLIMCLSATASSKEGACGTGAEPWQKERCWATYNHTLSCTLGRSGSFCVAFWCLALGGGGMNPGLRSTQTHTTKGSLLLWECGHFLGNCLLPLFYPSWLSLHPNPVLCWNSWHLVFLPEC